MLNRIVYDLATDMVVDILHNPLFFVAATFNDRNMFFLLQRFSDSRKTSANIFILTSVAVEFHGSVRDIGNGGAFKAEIDAHNVSVFPFFRFGDFVRDLNNNFASQIHDSRFARFPSLKKFSLFLSNFRLYSDTVNLLIFPNGDFKKFPFELEISIVDLTKRLSQYGYGWFLNVRKPFFFALIAFPQFLLVLFNDRLSATNTRVFNVRRKVSV